MLLFFLLEVNLVGRVNSADQINLMVACTADCTRHHLTKYTAWLYVTLMGHTNHPTYFSKKWTLQERTKEYTCRIQWCCLKLLFPSWCHGFLVEIISVGLQSCAKMFWKTSLDLSPVILPPLPYFFPPFPRINVGYFDDPSSRNTEITFFNIDMGVVGGGGGDQSIYPWKNIPEKLKNMLFPKIFAHDSIVCKNVLENISWPISCNFALTSLFLPPVPPYQCCTRL